MIYLKDRRSFATYRQIQETSAAMVLASFDANDCSSITVPVGAADQDDKGAWLVKDRGVYTVLSVTPESSKVTLKCAEALRIFDREVYFPSTGYTGAGDFIAAVIRSEFVRQPDELYAIPAMSVSIGDMQGTTFVPPEDDVFNLYDYLVQQRKTQDIYVTIGFRGNALTATVERRRYGRHNIVFGDGDAILDAEAYGDEDTVAKVTVLRTVTEDEETVTQKDSEWYRLRDGSIVPQRRAERITGRWEHITIGEDDDAEEKAREAFGETTGAHKIEFRSARLLALGDSVTFRFRDGRTASGRIAKVSRVKGENRYRYVSGDLAVTLTEKILKKG